jgi:hypothetical protein
MPTRRPPSMINTANQSWIHKMIMPGPGTGTIPCIGGAHLHNNFQDHRSIEGACRDSTVSRDTTAITEEKRIFIMEK